MPYAIRVQTTGTRLFQCACGTVGKFQVSPQSHRIECRKCHHVYMLGTVVFEVSRAAASTLRPPADAPLSVRWADRSDQDGEHAGIPYPLRARATHGEEVTIAGGVWRSADPVTIDLIGAELKQLWKHRVTGNLWIACSVAMGTRYLAQPLDTVLEDSDRVLIGRKEWASAMERVG